MKKIVNITINDIKDLINIKDNNTYVINVDSCRGLSTELLDILEKTRLDIKFKIKGDLYNTSDFGSKPKYNYDISQMKEIINVFEIIEESVQGLNEIGKFLYAYRLLCEIFKYNNYLSAVEVNLAQVEATKRSLYGSLINGEGVCVGFSCALYNLLNYLGINAKMINGIGVVNENLSGGHAWNAVEIGKKWYETDITWDLVDPNNLPFCLKVNEDFISSHNPYQSSEVEVKDLDYADADFNPELIYNYNYVIFNNPELKFKETLERIKKHIKKKQTVEAEDLSVKELATLLFGDDFEKNLSKSSDNKTL